MTSAQATISATMTPTTLLITCLPHSHKMEQALMFTNNALENHKPVGVFFYGDGTYIANRLCWQPSNIVTAADQWVLLANRYKLALPVCVSSALARGICDPVNADRHKLDGDNLRSPFVLTGLSDFVAMLGNTTLIQF